MSRSVKVLRPRVPDVTPAELKALGTIAYCQGYFGYSPSLGSVSRGLERKRLVAPFDPTYRWRLGWHLSFLGMEVLDVHGVDISAYRERTADMIRGP